MFGRRLSGQKYTDVVHIYAIMKAGYIPQLFSVLFAGQAVIHDLIASSQGQALIVDSQFASAIETFQVPCLLVPDFKELANISAPPPSLPDVSGDDIGMIFHTSGTTSGKPKPVPCTHKWLVSHGTRHLGRIWQGKIDGPDTFTNWGSFAHLGSATGKLAFMQLYIH